MTILALIYLHCRSACCKPPPSQRVLYPVRHLCCQSIRSDIVTFSGAQDKTTQFLWIRSHEYLMSHDALVQE